MHDWDLQKVCVSVKRDLFMWQKRHINISITEICRGVHANMQYICRYMHVHACTYACDIHMTVHIVMYTARSTYSCIHMYIWGVFVCVCVCVRVFVWKWWPPHCSRRRRAWRAHQSQIGGAAQKQNPETQSDLKSQYSSTFPIETHQRKNVSELLPLEQLRYYMYIYMYMHMHYMYIYMYMHMYIYVYLYVYAYAYIHRCI